MKNKIIALILCVCTLVPFFAIFSFAEGTEKTVSANADYGVPDDLYEMIDVNSYINNAGKEGYNQMKLIGFSAPDIVFCEGIMGKTDYYRVIYEAYIYNPLLYAIPIDTPYECEVDSGDGSMSIPYHAHYNHAEVDYETYDSYVYGASSATTEFFGDNIDSDHFHVYNAMFFSIEWVYEYTASQYEELVGNGLPLTVDSISFDIYLGDRVTEEEGNKIYEYIDGLYTGGFSEEAIYKKGYRHCHLDLGFDIYINDINSMLRFTTAYTDMSTFLNVSVDKLNEEYPLLEDSETVYPAFVYEDFENKGLYLYIYDSYGLQSFESILNEVYLSVDGTNYNLYELKFINFEGTLSKFKILGVESLFDNSSDTRTYYIKSIQYRGGWGLRKWSGDAYFTYSIDSNGEIQVDCSVDCIEFLEVGNTYYRLDSSVNSLHEYQTLSSVYFSIPERYFELNDDDYLNDRWIESISGQYYWAMTNPGIISSHSGIHQFLGSEKAKNEGLDGIARFITKYDNGVVVIGIGSLPEDIELKVAQREYDTYSVYIFDYNCYCPADCTEHILYENGTKCNCPNSSHIPGEFTEIKIDDSQILTALFNRSFGIAFEDEFKLEEFSFSKDDVQNLISKHEMSLGDLRNQTNFWNYLAYRLGIYSMQGSESERNISVFNTLYAADIENALKLSKEDFLNEYYVASADYENICEKMQKALDNNEVFVLLRFDVYDYYSAPLYYVNPISYIEVPTAFAFQDKVYKDFELLEIELKNQYNSKVYDVEMEPISFMSSITVPINNQAPHPDFEWPVDWNNEPFIDWNNILMILGIILVVALIVVVWVYVVIPISRFVSRK